MAMTMTTILPLGFLVVAVADDLIYRKFHNSLFLLLSFVGAIAVYFFQLNSFWDTFLGFWVGGLLFLPLVLAGALGAGDMKFMMCLGLVTGLNPIINIALYSLIWGTCIGLLKTFLSGQGKQFAQNLFLISSKIAPAKTQKIPYTVAILMGWLTLSYQGGLL